LIDHVGEALADAGDAALVADLAEALLERGSGAAQQRTWAREHQGALGPMVLRMADETAG
jgi:carboxylate-amine ligase